MDRDNCAADIARASTWEAIDDEAARVTVLATGAGYVRFVDGYGVASIVHHSQFRARYHPLYDRVQVRSQFNVSCANLGEFRIYWNPLRRKIIARSRICQREFALPPGVVYLGMYSAPFSPEDFLNDLDCLIATHERTARIAAAI